MTTLVLSPQNDVTLLMAIETLSVEALCRIPNVFFISNNHDSADSQTDASNSTRTTFSSNNFK